MGRVAAVVLAAGAATRFGAPKQRLLLPGVLVRLAAAPLDEIVVVEGACELCDILLQGVRLVPCPEWERGRRVASLRACRALGRRRGGCRPHGGRARLSPAAVGRVVDSWRAQGGDVVAASYAGTGATRSSSPAPAGAASRTTAYVSSRRGSSRATTSAPTGTSIRPPTWTRSRGGRLRPLVRWRFEIEQKVLAQVFTAIGVYLATLVATYFAVALAAAAADVLDGRDATVRATFLVVPILALEGLGPLAALDRSSALFRAKWGEQLAGTASIGVLFAPFGILPAVLLLFFGLAWARHPSRSCASSSGSWELSWRACSGVPRDPCSRSRSTATPRARDQPAPSPWPTSSRGRAEGLAS